MTPTAPRIILALAIAFSTLATPSRASVGECEGAFVSHYRVDSVRNDRKSGRKLTKLLEGIDDTKACERAFVEIGQGRYRLTRPIELPPHVDISGSGRRDTTIASDSAVFIYPRAGRPHTISKIRLVNLGGVGSLLGTCFAGDLRHVTLVGPFFTDCNPVVMRHVTAVERHRDQIMAFEGGDVDIRFTTLRGPELHLFAGDAIRVRDTVISARDRDSDEASVEYGIYMWDAEVSAKDVTVEVKGASENIGVFAYAGFPPNAIFRMANSTISARDNTLSSYSNHFDGARQLNYIVDSNLFGGPVDDRPDAKTTCTNVTDENGMTYFGACP